MPETSFLLLVTASGVGLGLLFFVGLHWTVGKGLVSASPALLFICSGLVRTVIVLAGFWFVIDGDWRRAIAALVGFSIARVVVMRVTRRSTGSCT